jgi:hypothetical protein
MCSWSGAIKTKSVFNKKQNHHPFLTDRFFKIAVLVFSAAGV